MPPEEVNLKDDRGVTALSAGALCGCHRTCAALIQAGADLSIRDADGNTAHDTAMEEHPANARLHALLRGEASETTCDECGMRASHAPKGKLLICACQGALYCSKPCQLAAWPSHKAECKQRREAHADKMRKAIEEVKAEAAAQVAEE